MAPNLHSKRHTHQAVVDFHQVRVKPEATSPSAPAATTAAVDTISSYWDWPATAPVVEDAAPVLENSNNDDDVLSTDHMIVNLVRAAARLQNRIVSEPEVATVKNTPSSPCTSSDDYWAEAQHVDQAKEEETAQAMRKHYGPQQDQVSHENNYWMEASHNKTSRDDYWNMSVPVALPHKVNSEKAPRMSAIPENRASSPGRSSASLSCYWQEKSHELQPSDDYWAESTMTTSTTTSKEEIVAVPIYEYWQWTTDVRTNNDQYWHWPAALPFACS